MHHKYHLRIFTMFFLSCSFSASSQLVNSEIQIWEKPNSTSREVMKCKDENLLNFHCSIKDRFIKKYIKYSKNKNHTLSLVHMAKEDVLIWEDADKNISLSNNNYKKGETEVQIRRKPSIFSYLGTSNLKINKDSLKIRLEDRHLYEMIFIPKKAKVLDINKIHSYLSIKYGISLEKGKYYASSGTVIWDPDKNKDFIYRPTGLGRDDGNELYQKQSTNQEDLFLAIGINDIKRTNNDNGEIIENANFAIWSDDNKNMSLKHEENFDVIERNWKINFIGEKISKYNYQVRINKEIINPRSLHLIYWILLKNRNGEIRKIQGIEKENYIIFNKVEFIDAFDRESSSYFTFAVSPSKDPRGENIKKDPTSGASYDQGALSMDLNQIAIYPNPVKKGQNFTLVFPPMENLIVSIYDAGGRLIALDKISKNSKSYMNSLPSQSSYLITLTQNGKIIKTFKLIVD